MGESKSDYEIVCAVAEKLGMLKEYTEGKSVQEWIKYGHQVSGVADMVSWEKLNEKGLFRRPDRPEVGDIPGRHVRVLQRPGETPPDDANGQAGV